MDVSTTRNSRKHEFCRSLQSRVPGVTRHRNPPGTRKSWVIIHENDQKQPKSRVLPIPLESCTGGHRASKSSRDPKIMGYNPRKRLEMAENTSFADPARVVYRGSHGIKFRPGLEKHGLKPTKTTRNCRKHEFCRSLQSHVARSKGIEILPGPEYHGL